MCRTVVVPVISIFLSEQWGKGCLVVVFLFYFFSDNHEGSLALRPCEGEKEVWPASHVK